MQTTSSGCLGWMVDTSHTPSLDYMQMDDTRDAATLLPIIRAHTAPATITHSDEWAAYSRISQDIPHLQHDTVNHTVEFVNRTNGVHTQKIECYWNRVKNKFKTMKGVQSNQLSSYMDHFI